MCCGFCFDIKMLLNLCTIYQNVMVISNLSSANISLIYSCWLSYDLLQISYIFTLKPIKKMHALKESMHFQFLRVSHLHALQPRTNIFFNFLGCHTYYSQTAMQLPGFCYMYGQTPAVKHNSVSTPTGARCHHYILIEW